MAEDNEKHCHWKTNFFISNNLIIGITTFAILFGVLATFGNSLVLVSIYRRPSLRSSHMLFIGSLAVADLSVGLITMPFYASSALTWPFLLKNKYFEMVLDFLVFQTLSASSLSLCGVSYDRFLAITFPMVHTSFMTKRKLCWAITMIWIISIIIGSCSFLFTGYNIRPSLYLLAVFVSFVIPLILIARYYFKIFKVARRHARQLSVQDQVTSRPSGSSRNEDESAGEERKAKREYKAAKTIAIVIGTFVACWLPNLIIGVVHFVVSRDNECEAKKTEQFWLTTIPFAIINSAINPAIYAARNEEFRKAFKQLLKF